MNAFYDVDAFDRVDYPSFINNIKLPVIAIFFNK